MSTPSKPSAAQYVWHARDPAERRLNASEQVKVHNGFSLTEALPTWAGDTYAMSAISAGTGNQQRVGNRIRPVQFFLRLRLAADGDALAATSQEVRAIIYQDLQQASDTKTAPDDILQNINDSGATLTPTHDVNYLGKARIFHDRCYSFGAGLPSTQIDELVVDGSAMLPISFNGSASTDVQKNGLYLLLITSTSTSPTPATYWPPGAKLVWRLLFHNA